MPAERSGKISKKLMLSAKLFYNKAISKSSKMSSRGSKQKTLGTRGRGRGKGTGKGRGGSASVDKQSNATLPPKKRSNPDLEPFLGRPAAFKVPRQVVQRNDDELRRQKAAKDAEKERKKQEAAILEMAKERESRQKHKLIAEIRSRELLYNRGNADYFDNNKTKLAWNAISVALDEPDSMFIIYFKATL